MYQIKNKKLDNLKDPQSIWHSTQVNDETILKQTIQILNRRLNQKY